MFCCGCYTQDDMWYRAQVTSVESENPLEVRVLFVDYGTSEVIKGDRYVCERVTVSLIPRIALVHCYPNQDNRPLVHHGNAANVEDKTKEFFSSGNWDLFSCKKKSYFWVLQIGCISTDVQGVYKSTHKLHSLLPPRHEVKYNLRNNRCFSMPRINTKHFQNTFIPAVCRTSSF